MVEKIFKPVYSQTSTKAEDVLTVGALKAILADMPDSNRVVISRLEPDRDRFFTHEKVVSEVFAGLNHEGRIDEVHIILNEDNGGGTVGQTAKDFFCVWERRRLDEEAMMRARTALLDSVRTDVVIPEVIYQEPGYHYQFVGVAALVDVSSIALEELDDFLDDIHFAFNVECRRACHGRRARPFPVLLAKHNENYLAFTGKFNRLKKSVDDLSSRVPGQPQIIEVAPQAGSSIGEFVAGACAIRRYLETIGVDALVHTSLGDRNIPITSNDPVAVMAIFRAAIY